MRVLIVKTSSLGDVIHTLPAVTDAKAAMPALEFDWLVEEAFVDVPVLHPAVNEVIPVALRRWRKRPFSSEVRQEWRAFKQRLCSRQYDLILDAQGLIKSAWLAHQANGSVVGLDRDSAREPWASLFYQKKYPVAKGQHAINRLRQLFAQALGYVLPDTEPVYGLNVTALQRPVADDYAVFLHGTTWLNKHWPEEYWQALAKKFGGADMKVWLPWGNEVERLRAERIAASAGNALVLPKTDLHSLAAWLAHARLVVGVDTGLSHLASALAAPTVALFGPTDASMTGVLGVGQYNLSADFECAPCLRRECSYQGESSVQPACFQTLAPERVWGMLQEILEQQR